MAFLHFFDELELELLEELELELLDELELELPAEAGAAAPAATTSPQAPIAVMVFQRLACLPGVPDVSIDYLTSGGLGT